MSSTVLTRAQRQRDRLDERLRRAREQLAEAEANGQDCAWERDFLKAAETVVTELVELRDPVTGAIRGFVRQAFSLTDPAARRWIYPNGTVVRRDVVRRLPVRCAPDGDA